MKTETETETDIKPFMKLKEKVYDTMPANEKKVLINTLLGEAGNVSIDKKTFARDEKWINAMCQCFDKLTEITKDLQEKIDRGECKHRRDAIWKRGISSPRNVSDKSIPDPSQDAATTTKAKEGTQIVEGYS